MAGDKPMKVYVFPVPGRQAEIAELKRLIEAAGCEIVCPDDPPESFEHCAQEADVVVILICPQTLDDNLIGPVVELANRTGKRIVGVWAADAEPGKLPRSLNRYGDSNIRIDAKDIAAAICRGEAVWVTPEGKPREKPKTPRHKGH
jgi:hypothetical protein